MELNTLLKAMVLAGPIVTASHFTDYKRCVEMSVAGSGVLKAFGFKPALSAVVVTGFQEDVKDRAVIMGAPASEIKELFEKEGVTSEIEIPDDNPESFHCILNVRGRRHSFKCDLTIGQLRALGIKVPLAVYTKFNVTELSWDTGANIGYFSRTTPKARSLESKWAQLKYDNLTSDFIVLTKLALKVKLDPNAFYNTLGHVYPDVLRDAWKTLDAYK